MVQHHLAQLALLLAMAKSAPERGVLGVWEPKTAYRFYVLGSDGLHMNCFVIVDF